MEEIQAPRESIKTAKEFPSAPWLSIWMEPRETIQSIVESDPARLVVVLAALGGISQSLDSAIRSALGDEYGLGTILPLAAILGSLSGVLFLFIAGALVRWTGGWIGGQASAMQIRAAIAWGSVPLLWVSLLWIPEVAIFGRELFMTDMPTLVGNPRLAAVLAAIALVKFVGVVWTLVTTLQCLGQVQGFSAWKALGNVLLASAVVIVPFMALLSVIARMAR